MSDVIDIDNQAINKEYLYEQFKLFNSNVLRSIYGMKSDNIDSIDTSNIGVGQVIQYTGETNANYINSFFYRWDGSKWTLINMGSSSMTFKAPLYSDGSTASLNLDYNDPNALTGELIPIDSTREVSLTEAIDENRSDILELMDTRLYTYTDLSQLESEVTLVADVDNIPNIIAAMKSMSQLVLVDVANYSSSSFTGYYDIKYYVYGTVINKLHIIKLDEGDAAIIAHMNTGAVLNRSMHNGTLSEWAAVGHMLHDGYEDDGTVSITGALDDENRTDDIYGNGALPSQLGLGEDVMTWPNGNYRVSHVNGDGLESVINLPNGATNEFRVSHFNLNRWGGDHKPSTSTYATRASILYSSNGHMYHRYQESGSTAGTLIKDTGWIKFGAYTMLAELGLDGTATIDQVIAAVPIGSSAFIDVIDFSDPAASGLPIVDGSDNYSGLYIDKQVISRTKVLFLRKDASRVLYGGMGGSPTITQWIEYATLNTDQTFTGAKTFNKPTTFKDMVTLKCNGYYETANALYSNYSLNMSGGSIVNIDGAYFKCTGSGYWSQGINYGTTGRADSLLSNNSTLYYKPYRELGKNSSNVFSAANTNIVKMNKHGRVYIGDSYETGNVHYKLATFSIQSDRQSITGSNNNVVSDFRILYSGASGTNLTIYKLRLIVRTDGNGDLYLNRVELIDIDNSFVDLANSTKTFNFNDYIYIEYKNENLATSSTGKVSFLVNVWYKVTGDWDTVRICIDDTYISVNSVLSEYDSSNEHWTIHSYSGVGAAAFGTSGYTKYNIEVNNSTYIPKVITRYTCYCGNQPNIQFCNTSTSWCTGDDQPLIYLTSTNAFTPFVSFPLTDGRAVIASCNNSLYFYHMSSDNTTNGADSFVQIDYANKLLRYNCLCGALVCGAFICGTTSVCSPAICGTTSVCGALIKGTNVCGTTSVCGACICGTTSMCSPSITGTNIYGTNVCGTTKVYGATVCGTDVCGTTSVRTACLCSSGYAYAYYNYNPAYTTRLINTEFINKGTCLGGGTDYRRYRTVINASTVANHGGKYFKLYIYPGSYHRFTLKFNNNTNSSNWGGVTIIEVSAYMQQSGGLKDANINVIVGEIPTFTTDGHYLRIAFKNNVYGSHHVEWAPDARNNNSYLNNYQLIATDSSWNEL